MSKSARRWSKLARRGRFEGDDGLESMSRLSTLCQDWGRSGLVWRCGLQSAFRLISPPAALGAAKKTPIPSPLCSRGPRAGARRDLLRLSPCLELRPAFQMKMWRISVILSVIPCSFSWRYTRQMSPRRVPRQVPAAFFCSGTAGAGRSRRAGETDTHPAGV